MNAHKNTTIGYRVRFTTLVDRPELRGPSYPVVAAGTKIHYEEFCTSYNRAIARFEELVRGEFDFSSEFNSKVSVDRVMHHGSGRTVRAQVTRTRSAK